MADTQEQDDQKPQTELGGFTKEEIANNNQRMAVGLGCFLFILFIFVALLLVARVSLTNHPFR